MWRSHPNHAYRTVGLAEAMQIRTTNRFQTTGVAAGEKRQFPARGSIAQLRKLPAFAWPAVSGVAGSSLELPNRAGFIQGKIFRSIHIWPSAWGHKPSRRRGRFHHPALPCGTAGATIATASGSTDNGGQAGPRRRIRSTVGRAGSTAAAAVLSRSDRRRHRLERNEPLTCIQRPATLVLLVSRERAV